MQDKGPADMNGNGFDIEIVHPNTNTSSVMPNGTHVYSEVSSI